MNQDIAELQALWIENNYHPVGHGTAAYSGLDGEGELYRDTSSDQHADPHWVVVRGTDMKGNNYTYVHRVWPRLIYEKSPGSSYVDYWV